jgi:hypothetical protein
VAPLAGEARQQVLRLRQLDLETPLPRLRPPREDVEDERRAVEYLDLKRIFQSALLRGAELVVEDDEGIVDVGALRLDLRQLALADVVGGMRSLQLLDGAADDPRPRRLRQQRQLIEGALAAERAPVRRRALQLDRDQVGPLDGRCCGIRLRRLSPSSSTIIDVIGSEASPASGATTPGAYDCICLGESFSL